MRVAVKPRGMTAAALRELARRRVEALRQAGRARSADSMTRAPTERAGDGDAAAREDKP